jgi:two-component system phosphate regulon sensor histidine kinase PhoR
METAGLSDKAWRAGLAFILALAALPTLLFALLLGFGALRPLPALLSWGLCVTVAAGFGLLLGRDIATMARLVRGLRLNPETLPKEAILLVPGMSGLGRETISLIRAERLRQARLLDSAAADRALVERLPDPLLKLDEAGNIIWRNASAEGWRRQRSCGTRSCARRWPRQRSWRRRCVAASSRRCRCRATWT